MIGFAVASTALRAAMSAEEAKTYGRSLGLTEIECRDIIDYWITYHRARLSAFDWAECRYSMARFAVGDEWQPERIADLRLQRFAQAGKAAMDVALALGES